MANVIFKNLKMMIQFKKQKQLLDKGIRDYLIMEACKKDGKKDDNSAIVKYEKPYLELIQKITIRR
jgi:hypothetical protein